MKRSFILYKDSLNVLDELTDEQAGKLFKLIKDYQAEKTHWVKNNPTEPTGLIKIVFAPFKAQFDRDDAKYAQIVERNKNNGKLGGRPKKKTQKTQMPHDSGTDKGTDSGSENESESVMENEKEKKRKEKKKNPFFVENLFLEKTKIAYPGPKHINPILEILERVPEGMTQENVRYCLVKTFDAIPKNSKIRIDYLCQNFEQRVSKMHEQILEQQKNVDSENKDAYLSDENLKKLIGGINKTLPTKSRRNKFTKINPLTIKMAFSSGRTMKDAIECFDPSLIWEIKKYIESSGFVYDDDTNASTFLQSQKKATG